MASFIDQKAVSMTFFNDCRTQNLPLLESQYFHRMDCFLHSFPLINISLHVICSVNFTWVALFILQKSDDKPETLFELPPFRRDSK